MVIKPEDIKKLDIKEKKQIKDLEEIIDSKLREKFDGKGGVGISTDIFKGFREPVVETLFNRYRQAGWDVEIYFDQRDGDYYRFSPKKYPE